MEQLEWAHPTSCLELSVPEFWPIIKASIERMILNNEDVETVLAEAAADIQSAVDALRAEDRVILE